MGATSRWSCALTLAGFLAVLQSGAAQQCSSQSPCTFTGGQPLKNVREVKSQGGTLSLNLTVHMANVTVEWLTSVRRTYNGEFPAPTWRIQAGDTVTVFLKNDLSANQPNLPFNKPRLPNSTNIHTHGLHISSEAPGDDVFIHVEPGKNFTYVYNIDPQQSAGTYWYHPHLHGSTQFQVEGGMAGLIIVDDPATSATPAHIQDASCPNSCQNEIPLIFQPALMYIGGRSPGFPEQQQKIQDYPGFRLDSALESYLTSKSTGINYMTTNGQLWPTTAFATGQIKRFRMVNAGGSAALELMVTDVNGNVPTTGCEVLEIAVDGIYLDKAVPPMLGKSFLVPSARTDWLVVCNKPGIYELRSTEDAAEVASLANTQRYNGKLLTINVTGSVTTTVIPTNLPARAQFNSDLRNLTQSEVTGRFVIEVDPSSTINRQKFISRDHYKFKMEVGTIQEWYLTNTNTHSAHPIHIHVNHFQVISYNAYTGPYSTHRDGQLVFFDHNGKRCEAQMGGYKPSWTGKPVSKPLENLGHEVRWAKRSPGSIGLSRPGVFRDVILVPPMVNITIRFKANKYTGTAVVHCHILQHEDKGMMFTVDIVPKGSNLTAFTKSGNGYPGQCKLSDPHPFNQVAGTRPGGAPVGQGPGATMGPKTTSDAAALLQSKLVLFALLAIVVGWMCKEQ